MGIPEPREQIPWFVLVHVELDFHREGRFGQEFLIHTHCEKLGEKSMHLVHKIMADDELTATVKVVMAAFDQQTRKAINVPSHWKKSLEQ